VVGIDDVLAASRAGVQRLTPYELLAAAARGALVVDTRTESHRRVLGEFPGAMVIDRTLLEWRLDPTSPWRIPGGAVPSTGRRPDLRTGHRVRRADPLAASRARRVPPEELIPAAEASRLSCELDRWVLHEAIRQPAAWRRGAGRAAGRAGSRRLLPVRLLRSVHR
jgi:hypothetical protein